MARTRTRDVALPGEGTLLARCLAAGLPVASSCSGEGACGKCLVTILAGAHLLESPAEHEREVLTRNGAAPPSQRLSCQCGEQGELAGLVVTTGYW